jgi:serine/threonine-protein kinase SRPK3
MSNSSDDNSDNSYESTSSDDMVEQSENLKLQGCILKQYNILYELGRGSCSIVWLVYDTIKNDFYAMKVSDPSEYSQALSEIAFVKKLPSEPKVFNNLIDYFIHKKNSIKYVCSIWNLHAINLDTLIRFKYNDGLPFKIATMIILQLCQALNILHNKLKAFHGDIKTDNILIKGINSREKLTTNIYLSNYNKNQENINRETEHKRTTDLVLKSYNKNIKLDDIDIENIKISLADFGTICEEHENYSNSFGTRYYQAPEIILGTNCSYPVDIWALGCSYYELLSGNILFDPIKDSKYSRDYYHLCLINETCGDFPKEFLKKITKCKNFFKNNNIINYKKKTDRMKNKINNCTVSDDEKVIINNILSLCLIINPSKRARINDLSNLFS